MSKLAVLLCGGKGTRLKPYTITFPKALMPIDDLPILEINVKQLRHYGFTRLVFAVNHQAELIKAYFGDGSKWGVSITYSLETTPLGTIGPLKVIDDLPDDFLVMNGDVLSNLDLDAFFEHHRAQASLFTISSYYRQDQSQYGVLEVVDGTLRGFKEKPLLATEVCMGINAGSKQILGLIPDGTPYGFDQLVLDLLKTGRPPAVRRFSGYWLDIGIPVDYERATELFRDQRSAFLPTE